MINHLFQWRAVAGIAILLAVVVLPRYSSSAPFGGGGERKEAAQQRSATPRQATATPARAGVAPTSVLRSAPATPPPPTATRLSPTAPPAVTAPPDTGQPYALRFEDLYSGATVMGPVLSDLARSLHGRKVSLTGYMAPPLTPNIDFFVLTKWPMSQCPFCSTAADWPFDIVFVRMAGNKAVPALVPTQGLRVIGTFSVGTATDGATGFVSQVRLTADRVDVLR